jgi:hypothetical protein
MDFYVEDTLPDGTKIKTLYLGASEERPSRQYTLEDLKHRLIPRKNLEILFPKTKYDIVRSVVRERFGAEAFENLGYRSKYDLVDAERERRIDEAYKTLIERAEAFENAQKANKTTKPTTQKNKWKLARNLAVGLGLATIISFAYFTNEERVHTLKEKVRIYFMHQNK